ncbi:MAG: tetratricopeptide repeat protein [Thermoanaerobaculales bacterium]|nr:tetratricopeptide repeat protein [Thermoanaerobaculales bacterium]
MSRSASDPIELDGCVAPFPGWAVVEVGGGDRERYLHSQVTSDVRGLSDGDSQLGALLDRSGRLQAFFFLHKAPERILLLVPEDAADRLVERLTTHLVADDVVVARRQTGPMRLALGPAAAAAAGDGAIPVAGWGSRGVVVCDDRGLDWPELPADELEARRVLGGPPAWGREVRAGQLVNETALLETAVAVAKGCYLGQETVAKIASHRGAARGPALLELEATAPELDELVGRGLSVDGAEGVAEVLSVARWQGREWLQVSLKRELRVAGRRLTWGVDDGRSFVATVRDLPLLAIPAPEAIAARLAAAASAAFAADAADRALDLLDRAIVICPTSADAHESRGVILGRLGRLDEAIAAMHRLLEVEPSSVMAHSNLSLFHNRLGDRETAEHHLALATRASMGAPAADRDDRAEEAERDRRRREEMFRRVLEIDPDDPLAHFGLGELAAERGRFAEAVGHLERTLAADPRHVAARLALGSALEGLGEPGRARAAYERGVADAAKSGDLAAARKMQERLNALNER